MSDIWIQNVVWNQDIFQIPSQIKNFECVPTSDFAFVSSQLDNKALKKSR